MSSLSVRQAAVQQVSTVIAGLLLCVREIVDWAVVATLLLCLAGRLLASLRGQRKGAASMMRLAGSGERYLGTRGSSDDDRLPNFRLHHIHRPGDGTSGSKGKFCSARSATHHPPLSKHRICLKGHGGIFCAAELSGHTRKPRSGLRRRRKGLTARLGPRNHRLCHVGLAIMRRPPRSWSTGTWNRRSTCDAGSPPACARRRPWRASDRAAWRPPSPSA